MANMTDAHEVQERGATHRLYTSLYVRIQGQFPCCKQQAFFRAVESVPREVYERTCGRCGAKWEVERKTLKEDGAGRVRRIDRFEWTCTQGARR